MDLLGRLAMILLCSLGATLFFYFFIMYFPTPSKPPPKHDLHLKNLLFKHQDDEKCDLFKGHWVPDLNGSLYTNLSCPTIPDTKNCLKNGRNDRDFLNWRWKPDGCELPRFDSKAFLQIVRGKNMAFIGDSVARNHMESLLCLLSKEETPRDMYNDSANRFRTWYFPSHHFTLMALWSKFLVTGEERKINGSHSYIYDLHLDKVDDKWAKKLPSLDYVIISNGHWFFNKIYLYQEGNIIGCVYCNEANVTDRGLGFTLRTSLRATLNYINECKKCKGVTTLLRTFSPSHFEHGTWNSGGSCGQVSPLRELDVQTGGIFLELRSIQIEEVEKVRKYSARGNRFEDLDITRAMQMRPDGHPGLYLQWIKGSSDCVHWCLPGPIDAWNDFLLAVLGKNISLVTGSSL